MDDLRNRRPDRAQRGPLVVAAATLVAIGAATLTPQHPATPTVPWYLPFANPGEGADALLNVILFVPLGVALALAGLPRRRSLWLVLAATVAVELLQGFVVPGRQASIGDVLTNTVGGWIGHAMAPALVAAWRAEHRRARRLAVAYGALWLAGTVAAAALLRPDFPAADAEAAPCGEGRGVPDCFPGRLAGPIRLWEPGRPDLAIGPATRVPVGRDVSLVAEIVDGGYAWRPGRIGGVATSRPAQPLLTLDQGGHALLLAARTRGARWGLRTPVVAMRGVFGRPGDRIVAEGGVTGNVRWLQVGARRVELQPSTADAWRLFFPWSAPRDATIRAVGTLFHAIALLPLAFWIARAAGAGAAPAATPRVLGVSITLATVATAFAGAALALDLAVARGPDWLGAVGGAVAGALLAGRARR